MADRIIPDESVKAACEAFERDRYDLKHDFLESMRAAILASGDFGVGMEAAARIVERAIVPIDHAVMSVEDIARATERNRIFADIASAIRGEKEHG
jgi:hypothetical protein